MTLYEVFFQYNDEQGSLSQGLVTVEAESEQEANDIASNFLHEAPEFSVLHVREVAEIPKDLSFTPRTLQ